MPFRPEIKDFIKNTLILTLFFTLVLHLSWGYVAPYLGLGAAASNNEKNFVQVGNTYLGNIATATSLALGQKEKITPQINPTDETLYTLSVEEMIKNPKGSEQTLIASHMEAIRSYAKVLSIDIKTLLENSADRKTTLDSHVATLKSYGNVTNRKITLLNEQITDLKNFINTNTEEENKAKGVLQSSLQNMNVTGVDGAIGNYTRLKNEDSHARIYLVYLERFQEIYTKMQAKNKTLLETLTNNKDILQKNTSVVIPNSGTEILRELGVIKTIEEVKKEQGIE